MKFPKLCTFISVQTLWTNIRNIIKSYELFNPIPISLPSLSPSSIQPLPLEAYINLDETLTPAPCTNLLEVLTTSRLPREAHDCSLCGLRRDYMLYKIASHCQHKTMICQIQPLSWKLLHCPV